MGRWAESEYDRVLIAKIKHMFDSPWQPYTRSTEMSGLGYQQFVRTLNTDDLTVRERFRDLAKQCNGTSDVFRLERRQRARRTGPPPGRPIARPRSSTSSISMSSVHDDNGAERAGRDLTVPIFTTHPSSPPTAGSSPDPIGLDPELVARRTSSRTISPSRLRRRSGSPSHSPNRARTGFSLLTLPPPHFEPPAPTVVSPPHSPSRAWLEEYTQHRATGTNSLRHQFTMSHDMSDPDYVSWLREDDLDADGPERRRRAMEIPPEEYRAATRRRYPDAEEEFIDGVVDGMTLAAADREADSLITAATRRSRTHQSEAPRRDTRRDGLVLEPWSPALPSSGNGGLFGSDAHLPESDELPSRRHTVTTGFGEVARSGVRYNTHPGPSPIPVYPVEPLNEGDEVSWEARPFII